MSDKALEAIHVAREAMHRMRDEAVDNGDLATTVRCDPDSWDRGYWSGYYDALRHALKQLPPYLVHPDPEDWREEGFEPPTEDES